MSFNAGDYEPPYGLAKTAAGMPTPTRATDPFAGGYHFLGVPIPDANVINSAGIVASAVEGFIRAASHSHEWVDVSDYTEHVVTCYICDTTLRKPVI